MTQQPGSYRHLDEQYLQKYGVRCAECGQLFVGKVLQAREKKYHPSCAKCSRCGGPFIEGDEMCIKGGKIWHLSCDGKRREERSIQEGSADNRENVDNRFEFVFQRTTTTTSITTTTTTTTAYHYGITTTNMQQQSISIPSPPTKHINTTTNKVQTRDGVDRQRIESSDKQQDRSIAPKNDGEKEITITQLQK